MPRTMTAAVAVEEERLCLCGCGETVGPNAKYVNGSHAWKVRGTQIPAEALAQPMRGRCAWCETAWNGTTEQVLAAQAEHREVCANRPPPPEYTLAQRRKMMKRENSVERERQHADTRAARQRQVEERDALAREKDAARKREREAREERNTVAVALRDSGLTFQSVADEMNRRGIRPAKASTWSAVQISSVVKRAATRTTLPADAEHLPVWHRSYSKEQRSAAATMLATRESIAGTARSLGISRRTIQRWHTDADFARLVSAAQADRTAAAA